MTAKRVIASWYCIKSRAYLELTEVTPEIGTIWYDLDARRIMLDGYYSHHTYTGCYHTLISAIDAVIKLIHEAARYGQILEQTREFRYA